MFNDHGRVPLRLILYSALLLVLLSSAGQHDSGSISRAQGETIPIDPVMVAVAENYPPFAWVNGAGELTGFDLELLALLTAQAGIQVIYRPEQQHYLIPALATHRYDIGAGCNFITPQRQGWVHFSQPYFATGVILVVQAGNRTITAIGDLSATLTVGAEHGSEAERVAHDQTQAIVIALTSSREALTQLAAGKLDAVLTMESDFLSYQQSQPDHQLKQVAGLLTYNECGFAVAQDQPALLAKLNSALAQLQSETAGPYAALYQKWFGQRPLPTKPVTRLEATLPTPQAARGTDGAATNITNRELLATTSAADLAGIYYLVITKPNATTLYPTGNASTYDQIMTLTDQQLWFISEATPTPGVTQTGRWRLTPQGQVEATLVTFAPPAATSPAGIIHVSRRDYQLTIAGDGTVVGHYTVAIYTRDDFAQSVIAATHSAQPLITQTVAFTGKRIE